MLGPGIKIYKYCELMKAQLELNMQFLATDQEKLDSYKLKNPDKILYINDRQALLNQRADSLELIEQLIEAIPEQLELEKNRQYVRGANSQKTGNQRPEGYYYTTREKEALRAQSIYEAQQKYNF